MSMAARLLEYSGAEDGEPSPAAPPPLPDLPHLVWNRIIFYLSDRLPTLLNISSLSADLRDMCRPHISLFFQKIEGPVPPVPWPYYYHHLLRMVLEGYLDPSYIYEFHFRDISNVKGECTLSSTTRPGLPKDAKEWQLRAFDHFYTEALRRSPFIPSDLESEVRTRFQNGDPDAALAVLLPLCTRLKLLIPPVGLELCTALFETIAREYQLRRTSPEDARQSASDAAHRDRRAKRQASDSSDALLFSELLVVLVLTGNIGCPSTLADLIPFIGIPSLRRIMLGGIRDREFPGWPTDAVQCVCPEIYFDGSSTSKRAILGFAEGLNGPCEIRQWYERPLRDMRDNGPGDPEWDRVLIKRCADGNKTIEARLDYEGGNPGYNYAWVSWIANGSMHDWRRLDEKFRVQVGEMDNEWIQGHFA